MKFNSQTMANSTKKASKLLAIAIAAIASYQVAIPIGVLTSAAVLTTQSAHAAETMMVTLVQSFPPNDYGYRKVLIQTPGGLQYFVWYRETLGAPIGSVVRLTYAGSGPSLSFYKLINTGNGKEASIAHFTKAN
jgi:hypothetical protein